MSCYRTDHGLHNDQCTITLCEAYHTLSISPSDSLPNQKHKDYTDSSVVWIFFSKMYYLHIDSLPLNVMNQFAM